MPADTRRFLVHQWTMIEVPDDSPVNLGREWHKRFGEMPPLSGEAVLGRHFAVEDERVVTIERPETEPQPELLRMVCTLVATKFSLSPEAVRVAGSEELPNLDASAQWDLNRLTEHDQVEVWPTSTPHDAVPVVCVFSHNEGCLLHRSGLDPTTGLFRITSRVEEALTFESVQEASHWLDLNAPPNMLTLKYVATVRAEQDRQDAALFDGY